jgi:CheY-like chemotaxis protein
VADPQPSPKTVLIIEDNLILREGLCTVLRRRGFDTHTAADGDVGLAMLAAVNPDLILLDMFMPVVDGWRFLESFVQSPHKHIPVIVTTSAGLSREWATDHGCVGFLKKPFDGDELFAEIGRVLGG